MRKAITTSALIRESSVVPLLCAAARVTKLPVSSWVIEGAIQELVSVAPKDGAFAGVAPTDSREQSAAVRRMLKSFRSQRNVETRGSRRQAHYCVSRSTLAPFRELLAVLPPDDRRAVDEAAGQLSAMVAIWSKNERTAGEFASAKS